MAKFKAKTYDYIPSYEEFVSNKNKQHIDSLPREVVSMDDYIAFMV